MSKMKLTGFITLFLLSAFLLSCQESKEAQLKSCSKKCKAQFEDVIGTCDVKKDGTESADCKFKKMNEYNDCVQVCNGNFMKNMNNK